MIIRKPIVGIDALGPQGGFNALIDVRSPSEFADDRAPGAINCPVLDDAERARVGTIYKQVSPFEARKVGAALVSRNIAAHIEAHFLDQPRDWRPLVYCWRGGQRSGAMVTVLRQIGWDACQLEGGYKAYRRHVVAELERVPPQFGYVVLTGATGSAKTRILQSIGRQGAQILDLEAIARHKGSVLGRLPDTPQPPQKLFESELLAAINALDPARPVVVEAESRKIGNLQVPDALIGRMRESPCIDVVAPRAARVEFLLGDYDYFTRNLDRLLHHLDALRPLRSNEKVDAWADFARAGRWAEFVDALLGEHYDALYQASQEKNYQSHHEPFCRLETDSLDGDSIDRLAAQAIGAMQQMPAPAA
jgi:tRNA 2-selenouridine synthase